MMSDEDWMRVALGFAAQAEALGEVPVGALLVSEAGDLLAEGFNQVISLNDPTAHAEVMALRKAGTAVQNYRLVNATLYVTLEPCAMCTGALVHARVKRVVFGAKDPRTGCCGSVENLAQHAQFNHQLEVISGVLADEAAAQLQRFFRQKRATQKEEKRRLNDASSQD
jgi:tRNA(adenine34) deaminase